MALRKHKAPEYGIPRVFPRGSPDGIHITYRSNSDKNADEVAVSDFKGCCTSAGSDFTRGLWRKGRPSIGSSENYSSASQVPTLTGLPTAGYIIFRPFVPRIVVGGGFRIASWRVDPQLNTIARNGASVRVEPKVMAVLVRLAEQAPDAVSREQLLQSVWPGIFVSDDVLTRCVSELRRVFEDDARESHIIQTIPKRGYRLVVPVEQDQQQGRELASDSCNPLFYCILIWNSVWRRCAAHAVRICAPD